MGTYLQADFHRINCSLVSFKVNESMWNISKNDLHTAQIHLKNIYIVRKVEKGKHATLDNFFKQDGAGGWYSNIAIESIISEIYVFSFWTLNKILATISQRQGFLHIWELPNFVDGKQQQKKLFGKRSRSVNVLPKFWTPNLKSCMLVNIEYWPNNASDCTLF